MTTANGIPGLQKQLRAIASVALATTCFTVQKNVGAVQSPFGRCKFSRSIRFFSKGRLKQGNRGVGIFFPSTSADAYEGL